MMDDANEPEFSKSVKIKQLAVMANRLVKIMDDTWTTYTSLFDLIDMQDLVTNEKAVDAIFELESELCDLLDTVRLQIKMLKLVDEPLPTDIVEDFEASILQTLGKLDAVNLEQYRRLNTEDKS